MAHRPPLFSRRRRVPRIAIAVTAILLLAPVTALDAHVKVPPTASTYAGTTEEGLPVSLRVSGNNVQIFAFSFDCHGKTTARSSLESLPLRRTSAGYTFKLNAFGIVGFADEQPEENAELRVRGRFHKHLKSVKGKLRADAERCHDTGWIEWSATPESD